MDWRSVGLELSFADDRIEAFGPAWVKAVDGVGIETISPVRWSVSIDLPRLKPDQIINVQLKDMTIDPRYILIRDGYPLVRASALARALDVSIKWDTDKLQLAVGSQTLTMKAEDPIARGRGVLRLDVPPVLIDGSFYIPLRSVSEWLGALIDWDEK